MTLGENIALGVPEAGREAIANAARIAGLEPDLAGMPDGLDTVVGERGITLSGGQKQRLALARAFLIEPRILIMDDATASVDAKTEHLIQDAMKRVARGRTTFVISHRLSSVQWADRILVLDGGRLVASGTQLRPFSNEILDACLKATNELWGEISAKNADFKKAIDAMQAYRSDEYLWWQVAEYTYDSFMIRSRTRG